jgi:8-oxo-dGTP diphosphatase
VVILSKNEPRKACHSRNNSKGDRILLARRSLGDKLAGFWEFPGGKVESGETPEQSLARELFEEPSIVAQIGKTVGESSHQYEHGSFRLIAFLVDNIQGEPRPNVHDRLEWAKIDDLTSYERASALYCPAHHGLASEAALQRSLEEFLTERPKIQFQRPS